MLAGALNSSNYFHRDFHVVAFYFLDHHQLQAEEERVFTES